MFSRIDFSVRSHFQLFCLLMDSWEFRMFNRSHNNFEFGKLLKHLCYAHVLVHSSNAIFNILKSCVAFFTNFMQHLMQTCCYIKSAILKVHQICKWNRILLHLPWHYSILTHTTCLFQAGNDFANSTLFTSNERSLYHQHWCYLKISAETNHTTFLDNITYCEFTLHYFRMFCVWVNTLGQYIMLLVY